jgi:hypothetical protein
MCLEGWPSGQSRMIDFPEGDEIQEGTGRLWRVIPKQDVNGPGFRARLWNDIACYA